ncbi:hypothetical protein [Rheinheimera fenheensis]|uniref:hypothetical protein n=1 Tax=Rheinheimera fenheensis TaxID=3152295 RepID=UPI00325F4963
MMNKPDPFEQHLKQQFQHDKACHPLPRPIVNRVLAEARRQQQRKGLKRIGWPQLWRNTQLALSCALLVLLGYFLLPVAQQPKWHYQISYAQDAQYRQIQHHTAGSAPGNATALAQAQQQYREAGANSNAFYAQTGLLRQEQQQWHIQICDELLLTIDKQLLSQIDLTIDRSALTPQWVEFTQSSDGTLLAIKPAQQALQCPHS